MRVLALTDSLAPWHSFWIRFGQYIPELPWPVVTSSDVTAIDALGQGDRLLFYRYNPEWGDLALKLQAARTRGVQIVSDLDDYLWQANGWSRARLRGYTYALRLCHQLSCSTRALQHQVAVMFPSVPVRLLPNTAPKVPAGPLSTARPITVGWTGAPWTRPKDLALLKPLAQWIAHHPNQVQLVHIGHCPGRLSFAEALELPEHLVITKPLQDHASYIKDLHFAIGLAPLAPSTFNQYKSAIKVIEYSSRGIPWLASDAGPYRELCLEWQWPGRLCGDPEAWIKQLQTLVLDPDLRRQESFRLQERCQLHASYAQGVDAWRELLAASC